MEADFFFFFFLIFTEVVSLYGPHAFSVPPTWSKQNNFKIVAVVDVCSKDGIRQQHICPGSHFINFSGNLICHTFIRPIT